MTHGRSTERDQVDASGTATVARPGSLLVIFLTVFIDLLGFGMVIPLLPIYADQFTTDPTGWQLGLLMASFSAMQFVFAPLWGILSDRIGRRPVLMVGLASSALFYLLFGIATLMQSLWLLLAARIGAGIAGATISTAQAYIADTTSLQQRPRGMALIGMAFGLGFTFGPLLGFLAVPDRNAAPGPWPGYAAALLSVVAFLLAALLLPESKHAASESAVGWLPRRENVALLIGIPSMLILLVTVFVCIFSFANFETTLSLLIKSETFRFSWGQICLTYAFIGLTLAMVQGGIVRRLAGRVSEGVLAGGGAMAEVLGFVLVARAASQSSTWLLFLALFIVVAGFSFMQPNLNSLLSRRTPPDRQGAILGVGQGVSALARIVGSAVGIPLLKLDPMVPYTAAALLMAGGAVLVAIAARRGSDYASDAPP